MSTWVNERVCLHLKGAQQWERQLWAKRTPWTRDSPITNCPIPAENPTGQGCPGQEETQERNDSGQK